MNSKINISILCLVGLILFCSKISGQKNEISFAHITTQDGLSQDVVQCILQDSKGFMWIGTKDGLNCYDGYKFTIYKHSTSPGSLSNNVINDILEDKEGFLWISTLEGLNRFDRNSVTFTVFRHDPADPNSLNNGTVAQTCEDNNGDIWVGTFRNGLNLYSKKTKKFKHFFYSENDSNTLSSNTIFNVIKDNRGIIWINADNGLNKFNAATGRFIRFKNKDMTDPRQHPTYRIGSMFEDSKNNLWLGIADGLYIVNLEKNDVERFIHKSVNPDMADIKDIKEDLAGNLWIGTMQGLVYLDQKTHTTTKFIHNDLNNNSLTNKEIWKLYYDKKKTLWIGTYTGGINLYNSDYKGFKLYRHHPLDKNSLSHNYVLSFLEDSDGEIWIGTDGGGINKFDRRTGNFTSYTINPKNPNSISSNNILSIKEDHEGNIWIGTWNKGVCKFNKKTGKFVSYLPDLIKKGALNNPHVWSILEDTHHNLWFGTMNGGLNLFDRSTSTFSHFMYDSLHVNESYTSDNNVWALYQDKDGYIWAGASNGLNRIDPVTKKIMHYLSDDKKSNTLSNSWVTCIYEDSKRQLWVGTQGGGINLLDRKTGKFTAFGMKDGLANDLIYGILEDNKGDLWLSTNKGISKFRVDNKTFQNFDILCGLQGYQFGVGSYLKTKNGEMFFGGPNGFNCFFSDSINLNTYVPPIVFTDFQIFNKSVGIGNGSVLQKHISQSDEITLRYDQSVFTIQFAALNFIDPSKNQYSYILEGFDKNWNNIGTKHEATYTNLDPRTYTFKVKGSNNDGLWNDNAAAIRIIILPPYWKTVWFKFLVSIFIIALLIGVYYFRMKQISNLNSKLKILVHKRTTEIEEKNVTLLERQHHIELQSAELTSQRDELSNLNATKDKLFSVLAHDLRNPFHVISGFSQLMLEDLEKLPMDKIRKFIGLIETSSCKGNDLLENLLQWSRAQTGRLSYEPEIIKLDEIVSEVFILLEGNFLRKSINATQSIGHDTLVMADRNLLKTVLRNLVSNAIKFTHANGNISIKAINENTHIQISVSDDGVGMSPDNLEKLFRIETTSSTMGTEQESGTGLGLLLCKEFVEKQNGTIWIESVVNKGSIVYFTLPLASMN